MGVRRGAPLRGEGTTDGLGAEALDHVALLEIIEPGKGDAAFEAGCDFADVVPEATQRLDPVGGDDLPASPDPGAASDDPPVGDVRARDDLALANLDDLADLGPTLDDLDLLRLEEPGEGLLDVVGELVDDVVEADVDLLGLGRPPGRVADPGVEADDDRVRGRGQKDVVVGDLAGALVEDVDLDLVRGQLAQGVGDRPERAGDVGLEDDPELLGLAGLDLPVEVLKGRSSAALSTPRGDLGPAGLDQGPGFPLVGHDAEDVAGLGDLGQAEDDRGGRGTGLRNPLAELVLEGPDAAERLAHDDDVADPARAGLDEGRRHRTAGLVHPGLDDRADRGPLR